MTRNADAEWDAFDPDAYVKHNYGVVRKDDAVILDRISNFYLGLETDTYADVVDVGTGPNLYPLLAVLPIATSITVWEVGDANIAWMNGVLQSDELSRNWLGFWNRLQAKSDRYRSIEPLIRLREILNIQKDSILSLPRGEWGLASMHFCAESITEDVGEFEAACERFALAVRPGGAVCATFMENSTGYQVGGRWFPAFPVTVEHIRTLFSRWLEEFEVERLDLADEPVREGYTGMLVLTGRRLHEDDPGSMT